MTPENQLDALKRKVNKAAKELLKAMKATDASLVELKKQIKD